MAIPEPRRRWREQPLHEATLLLRQLMLRREELEQAHAAALGVNQIDYRAMGVLLGQGPVSPGQLARHLGTTPSATSNIIERLEQVGHVRREPDPDDRRRVRVEPTPASVGRALGNIAPMVDAAEASVRAMSEQEQAAVSSFLRATLASMDSVLATLAAPAPDAPPSEGGAHA